MLFQLSKINLVDPDMVSPRKSLDVRMVIDIYTGRSKVTVSLNYLRSYKFLDKYYLINPELSKWIDSHVTGYPFGK